MEQSVRTERFDASMFKSRRVLVTGGAGFIGGHITARLVELGAQVAILDRDCSVTRETIINLKPGLREEVGIHEGSVFDYPTVLQLLKSFAPEYVFHTAACATIEQAASDPLDAIQTNAIGLVTVLEGLRNLGMDIPVLFTSTDKVYGGLSERHHDFFELEVGYNEDTPLRGIGIYDGGKLASDVMAQTYVRSFGSRCSTVRLCNTFGPYDFNHQFRVVPKSSRLIFQGRVPSPPVLYAGSMSHVRDYLYIDDMIDLLLMVITNPQCSGETYNALGGDCLSTSEVIQSIVNLAAEIEPEEDRAAKIKANGIRVEENKAQTALVCGKQYLNGEKLVKATGFSPKWKFEDGLRETVRFYQRYFRERVVPIHEKREVR